MEVKLYTQPGCPLCRTVHMLLEKHKISYEESQDTEEMKSLGISGTPALVVNGKVYKGKDIHDWIRENGEK